MRHATVSCYRLPDDARIEEVQSAKGGATWAVRNRFSECLNHQGEWEHEPLPSSRDDAFLARCRFPTPEAAYATWEAHRGQPNPA